MPHTNYNINNTRANTNFNYNSNNDNAFKPLESHNRSDYSVQEDLQPTINTSVDEFGVIDATQRQGRTINVIWDLISNLFNSCVSPCTLDAFQQNRCCETYVVDPALPPQPPPPPPPPQPLGPCCAGRPGGMQPLPAPLPPLPLSRPPPPNGQTPVVVVATPINCCTVCTFTYYGPPPCSSFYRNNSYNNYNNYNYNNNRRVTVYVPPPYYG